LPPNVVATYGMTETGSGVIYDGRPLEGVEVSFRPSPGAGGGGGDVGGRAGEANTGGGAGAEGEILLRGPMLLRGYRDGGDGRVVGPDGAREWFATGDAGALDADGKLVVSGRIADVITTGAEKVWPDAVERILMAHPGVAEVAIWKRPDPEWGERVVAWVVPIEGGPSLAELRQIVTDGIAPWAAPKEMILVDDLPRTAAGKVRRRELDSFG
jgi:O-succinylbenzoic acid--CoA ligase